MGKRPYEIVYEDLLDNYAETMRGALVHLGLDCEFPYRVADSQLQRQHNELSLAWCARYRRERADSVAALAHQPNLGVDL